eukprot:9498217-Heterocapsa_arctica.AAC.1
MVQRSEFLLLVLRGNTPNAQARRSSHPFGYGGFRAGEEHTRWLSHAAPPAEIPGNRRFRSGKPGLRPRRRLPRFLVGSAAVI